MRRVPELDGLRGLAALSILTYHLKPNFLPFGWAAVDVFFVLSGYLITSILLRNVGSERFFTTFYARRALRIWPVYYLTILAGVAVNALLPRPYPIHNLPYLLTFTQNIQHYLFKPIPAFPPIFEHFWTLAMEEQYYLIWPAIVVLCSSGTHVRSIRVPIETEQPNFGTGSDRRDSIRNTHNTINRGLLVAVALFYWSICYGMRRFGFDGTLLLTRGDGFVLGSLLAIAFTTLSWSDRDRVRCLWLLGVAAAGGVVVVAANLSALWPIESADQIIAVNVAGFGVVGLSIMLAGSRSVSFLRVRPLRYIGTISYGLYVYHIPVLWGVEHVFRRYARHASSRPGSSLVARVARIRAELLGRKPFLVLPAEPDTLLQGPTVLQEARRGRAFERSK